MLILRSNELGLSRRSVLWIPPNSERWTCSFGFIPFRGWCPTVVSTLKEEGQPITWEVFKESLDARYGPTQFEDFFGDLTKFKQMGTVRDYQSQFERLLTRAGKLTPSQQVGCFYQWPPREITGRRPSFETIHPFGCCGIGSTLWS